MTAVETKLKRLRLPKKKRLREAIKRKGSPDIIAELCRRSFAYFIKEFWECISAEELSWNWHIDVLAQELEELAYQVAEGAEKDHDLFINIPPGTTKSITCSIMFPVWCWIKWFWMRFIVGSYSGALALEHADYSRDLVKSDKFREIFPELEIKRDRDTKSNFRITEHIYDRAGKFVKTEIGGNRFSTSVGGTVTGYHAHIIIIDDPLDPNRAASEVELKNANHWMTQTIPTRKVDKAVTPTILIMQRLHQDDPTGHILAKGEENIRHICLPGEIRNYAKYVNPPELKERYENDLLDPDRMSWKVMRELESILGQYGYAGQIGQNPTPPGGGMFKVDHFHIITEMPSPINIVASIRYWDKAATADGGAYTAGVKMHRMRNGKFIVSGVERGQWASEEREAITKETAEADGRNVIIWIEQEGGSGGKESAEATIRNLAGYSVHADRPVGDKVFRADPYSVQVNAGNVLLLQGDWNHDFIEEHRYFPFGTYKDQVDAAAAAFNKLAGKKKVRSLLKVRSR